MPLNVVDRPQWCSFIVPSMLRRGDLTVAVSTGGGSPALAGACARTSSAALGPEYERALDVLARLRRHLQAQALSSGERQRILTGLVASDLLDRLREPDAAAVDRLLAEHAGRRRLARRLEPICDERRMPPLSGSDGVRMELTVLRPQPGAST